MFINSEVTVVLSGKKITPLAAFKVQSLNSEISTSGLQRGVTTTFFIPEKENADHIADIKTISKKIKTGTDYIQDEDGKKYAIKGVVNSLHGSEIMRHLEVICE